MAFKAYVLDIEGTTTPIDFVTKTLFPYARKHLSEFLHDPANHHQLHEIAELASQEFEAETEAGFEPAHWPGRPDPSSMSAFLEWMMDVDRKSTSLKAIQGLIWEHGYLSGQIKGEVYRDVEPAIRRWKSNGASVHIFSSGSVLAQRLLFQHLPQGDLTPLLDSYFDTTTGPKRMPASYQAIAKQTGEDPNDVLFLSDIIEEIEAAREAGMAATQVFRDRAVSHFPVAVSTFDDVP